MTRDDIEEYGTRIEKDLTRTFRSTIIELTEITGGVPFTSILGALTIFFTEAFCRSVMSGNIPKEIALAKLDIIMFRIKRGTEEILTDAEEK